MSNVLLNELKRKLPEREDVEYEMGADKLQAIKILAPDTYNRLEKLLNEQLEKIYIKSVPLSTRKYIEAKMESEDTALGGNRKQ